MPREAPVMRMVFLVMKPLIETSKYWAVETGRTDIFVYRFRLGPPSETNGISMRHWMIGFYAIACVTLPAASMARAAECADQTQNGLNACADAAYRKADAALNVAYKDIIARLKGDAATTKLLVAAQKAWIGYRDAECDFS